MTEFTYDVFAFRQQDDAPIQVAFVAPAGDVLRWSGVPRKSDELLSGYQRFRDDKRIDREIVPFFQDSRNCSPTAIIVALRSDTGIGECKLAELNIPPGETVSTKLTITIDEKALQSKDVFSSALEYVKQRLAEDSSAADNDDDEAIGSDDESSADDEYIDDTEEDQDEDEEDDDSGQGTTSEIHLGSATLGKMRDLLENQENWTNLSFRTAVADYVKPALLIDGQHRVAAAARLGINGLPFMICGLFGADWQEQVFHFTVVNLKPKRIPPALITSIAGLSLTRTEQTDLSGRLSQAGIKMREVKVMSLVAYDGRSPFTELVDMAVTKRTPTSSLLGYGSVKRTALVWYSARRTSLVNIAKQLLQTNNSQAAKRIWQEEDIWFDFFCLFWETVRDSVPGGLWGKSHGNRFFIGAHLWALQEALLLAADGQMASWWRIQPEITDRTERFRLLREKLMEVLTTGLAYFPPELWTANWKKSQDTTAGREELAQLFGRFIDEGKQHGKWRAWKKDAWFQNS